MNSIFIAIQNIQPNHIPPNINRNTENNVVNSGLHSYLVKYLWFDIFRMFIINNKK